MKWFTQQNKVNQGLIVLIGLGVAVVIPMFCLCNLILLAPSPQPTPIPQVAANDQPTATIEPTMTPVPTVEPTITPTVESTATSMFEFEEKVNESERQYRESEEEVKRIEEEMEETRRKFREEVAEGTYEQLNYLILSIDEEEQELFFEEIKGVVFSDWQGEIIGKTEDYELDDELFTIYHLSINSTGNQQCSQVIVYTKIDDLNEGQVITFSGEVDGVLIDDCYGKDRLVLFMNQFELQ